MNPSRGDEQIEVHVCAGLLCVSNNSSQLFCTMLFLAVVLSLLKGLFRVIIIIYLTLWYNVLFHTVVYASLYLDNTLCCYYNELYCNKYQCLHILQRGSLLL